MYIRIYVVHVHYVLSSEVRNGSQYSLTLSSISLMHCGLQLFVAQWRGKRPSLSFREKEEE